MDCKPAPDFLMLLPGLAERVPENALLSPGACVTYMLVASTWFKFERTVGTF